MLPNIPGLTNSSSANSSSGLNTGEFNVLGNGAKMGSDILTTALYVGGGVLALVLVLKAYKKGK